MTAVSAALLALETRGRLTPSGVVEAAREPSHPLHSHFEWDDALAGEAYRLEQARHIIRSVRLETTTTTEQIDVVRYVRDPKAGKGQGYVTIPKLRTEKQNAQAAMQIELTRAIACLKRAEQIAEALGIQDAITSARERLESVWKRVA